MFFSLSWRKICRRSSRLVFAARLWRLIWAEPFQTPLEGTIIIFWAFLRSSRRRWKIIHKYVGLWNELVSPISWSLWRNCLWQSSVMDHSQEVPKQRKSSCAFDWIECVCLSNKSNDTIFEGCFSAVFRKSTRRSPFFTKKQKWPFLFSAITLRIDVSHQWWMIRPALINLRATRKVGRYLRCGRKKGVIRRRGRLHLVSLF